MLSGDDQPTARLGAQIIAGQEPWVAGEQVLQDVLAGEALFAHLDQAMIGHKENAAAHPGMIPGRAAISNSRRRRFPRVGEVVGRVRGRRVAALLRRWMEGRRGELRGRSPSRAAKPSWRAAV